MIDSWKPTFFLRFWDNKLLKITLWNINGVANKLETNSVIQSLWKSDIIMLNEIKTNELFSLPGYATYRSLSAHHHRGGCAVLSKKSSCARYS